MMLANKPSLYEKMDRLFKPTFDSLNISWALEVEQSYFRISEYMIHVLTLNSVHKLRYIGEAKIVAKV